MNSLQAQYNILLKEFSGHLLRRFLFRSFINELVIKHQDKSIHMSIFVVTCHIADTELAIIMWTEGKNDNMMTTSTISVKDPGDLSGITEWFPSS